MIKKGGRWVWPETTDEMWYDQFDVIIKKDNGYKLVNKSGMYEPVDSLLCSDCEESK